MSENHSSKSQSAPFRESALHSAGAATAPAAPAAPAATPATPAGSPAADSAAGAANTANKEALKEKTQQAAKQAKAAAVAVRNYFSKKGTLWKDIFTIPSSLFSRDPATRRMTLLFFLSLAGFLSVSTYGIKRYWAMKRARVMAEVHLRARHLKELVERETDEARRLASTLSLGSFTLELNELVHQKNTVGQVNMAEVEVVILCDSAETREYIDQNMIQVRNQMTNVFTMIERDELLSRDGKRRIKTILIRKLNEFLPHGKIEDVYFSKLIVS